MGMICMICGKAKDGPEQECTNCGSKSWVDEQFHKRDKSAGFEFQTRPTEAKSKKPVITTAPKPTYIPKDSIMSFANIAQASEYRISADSAGMSARLAGDDIRLNWENIESLSFEQH